MDRGDFLFSYISLLVIVGVSLDGFCLGYALGMSKYRFKIIMFIMMGLIAGIMSLMSMSLGSYLFGIISESQCRIFCSMIFFLLAYMASDNKYDNKNPIKLKSFTLSLIGGFVIAFDASIAAFALALEGYYGNIYPIMFGIFHFVLSYAGYLFSHSFLSSIIKEKIPYIASIILCALGIIRLI